MILDSEEQRTDLLNIFNATAFNGGNIENALRLKVAIMKANITEPEKEKKT